MVKLFIPFALLAISASLILAKGPEFSSYISFSRREASDNDLFARDSGDETDNVALEQREPVVPLAVMSRIARVGSSIVGRIRHFASDRRSSKSIRKLSKRDLDPEDEVDFVAREDDGDDMFERELDMVEREMSDEDILSREVDEDMY